MKKLLITGAWKYSENQYSQLQQAGYDICFAQNEQSELPDEAYEANIVICNALFMYHSIERFSKLETIQLISAGYDRVPMKYIKEHNITIYNARGVYSKPMAEFAICGVLQLYKKSRFFLDNQKKHMWVKHRGLGELEDKTVCIVGCGSIGTECAKCFSVFGCKVIGVGQSERIQEYFDEVVTVEKLDNTLIDTDILILSIPLSYDTYHLIDRRRLNLLKKSAVIVNVARGSVMDTDALIERLPYIGGAVLDVFEEEPLSPDSELWDLGNVIITPHNSFVGETNGERLGNLIIKNLSN